MTEGQEKNFKIADDWDAYWRGMYENPAHRESGSADEEALTSFWRGLFAQQITHRPLRLLDLACGSGAVTALAVQAVDRSINSSLVVYCLDQSVHAVATLAQRYPSAHGVAADASRMPFADHSFDFVASNFGLEYAGIDAFVDAARVLAPGGTLATVVHLKGGAIYRRCADEIQLLQSIRDSRLLELAADAFGAGFALNAGDGSVAAFKAAEQRFTPAIKTLEDFVRRQKAEAVSTIAQQLYSDIAHMYQRMSAYAPQDVLGWIDRMALELEAYAGRMRSMVDIALDAPAMELISNMLEGQGLTIIRRSTLNTGAHQETAAWVLESRRN